MSPAARNASPPPTQRDLAYRALRRLLILQKVPEGQRLREPEWARRLGVNRMALREAFARLEAEGLILRGPMTGYFVPTLSDRDMREVLQVRQVLECAAIDEICAAGRTRRADQSALRAACDDLERMIRRSYTLGVSEADRRFHEALIELSGNRRLALIYHRAPLPMIHNRIVGTARWIEECQRTLTDHRQVLAALAAADARRAKTLLRQHLSTRYLTPLSDQP